MKKRTYRAVNVKGVNVGRLAKEVAGQRLLVGVDIGKETCLACLMAPEGQVYVTIRWKSPGESRLMVEVLQGLGSQQLEVAMEPSGSYGDAFRHLLWDAGIAVYRVSAKRSHDATEVYDGVPSSHDPKSAAIVAKLHGDGVSQRWPVRGEAQRALRVLVSSLDALGQQFYQGVNRLEGLMARYWPEVGAHLDFSSVTFLRLLERFGGPEGVRAEAQEAEAFMRSVGGHLLSAEKIQGVIVSSRETIGVRMIPEEVEEVRQWAAHTLSLLRAYQQAKRKVEEKGQEHGSVEALSPVVGKATAAVLVALGGDPRQYGKASQWEKTLGLNLKERSSGKHLGQRRITKRGSSKARKWLYFAALRLIQRDRLVQAWYRRKVSRDGNVRIKAIVAVMRKYVKALWHVARGEAFDSRRLFDARNVGLGPA